MVNLYNTIFNQNTNSSMIEVVSDCEVPFSLVTDGTLMYSEILFIYFFFKEITFFFIFIYI